MHVKRDAKEHNFQRLQQQEHAKVVDISKRYAYITYLHKSCATGEN